MNSTMQKRTTDRQTDRQIQGQSMSVQVRPDQVNSSNVNANASVSQAFLPSPGLKAE